MTRPARMPFGAWPRGLRLEVAAAYRGVSPNKWLAEVKAKIWPEPEISGGCKIWDRHKIDEAWDHRHEAEADPLMEALNDRET